MSRKQESTWQDKLLWLGLSLVNFEGLAGFILFLLVLAVLVLWAVYRFAAIIVPALAGAVAVLVALFIPFHAWTKATITIRARKRIACCLREIRTLERSHAYRTQILPLEQRVGEAAQVLTDCSDARARQLRRKQSNTTEQRQQLQTLSRECEDLRIAYGVVPEPDWWWRFFRLHLEWDSIRWMAEHPGAARLIVLAVLAILTTAVAAVLPEL